jgi:ATP synthase protein I
MKAANLMNAPEPENPSLKPQAKAEDERNAKRSIMLQAAKYSHLALALPAATFIGWLLGTMMDRWLHTTWIYVLGLILGIIAGFVDLVRAAMMASRDE